jgi:hypothetical protein
MQCLALTPVIGIAGLRGEHKPERVDDVRTGLRLGPSLAKDTGDLGNRRDDPPFLAGLVDDRQVKLIRHTPTIPTPAATL